jgi:hypothetical protein
MSATILQIYAQQKETAVKEKWCVQMASAGKAALAQYASGTATVILTKAAAVMIALA